ncbi:MAG TPA: NUDIX domain-containing protein, partial [Acidobacteriota bacterium]
MVTPTPPAPHDAATVVLLRDRERPRVLIARRSPKQRFLGGYHAFAGGRMDPQDAGVPLRGASGEEAVFRVVALRELLEETGILIGADADAAVRQRLRAGLQQGRALAELLQAERLELDAAPLERCGRWVTPPFSPQRFHTWFFLAWLPAGQEAEVSGELEEPDWLAPAAILERWERREILLAPPTLFTLRALAEGVEQAAQKLERRTGDQPIRKLPFRPDVMVFPQRTPTRPPATHTNAYLLGRAHSVAVDPGSASLDELEPLAEEIQSRISTGGAL